MTQEMIADMLGVRREAITEAARMLQKAGLIHYSRGHIAVLDRPQLEAQVSECYLKRESPCRFLSASDLISPSTPPSRTLPAKVSR
jgi:biotin operon repressor